MDASQKEIKFKIRRPFVAVVTTGVLLGPVCMPARSFDWCFAWSCMHACT